MTTSRRNPWQLPLDGIEVPTNRDYPDPATDLVVLNDPPPRIQILTLPRWDTDWQIKTGRGGWPKINPKTGKVIKHRVVWDSLQGNSRTGHWSARAHATRIVITDIIRIGTAAGLTPCQHLTIRLVWAPGNWRIADPDNLWNLQKVIADGLARGPRKDLPGLRLVPDDVAEWMTKLAPRIDRPPTPEGLWLEVQQR